MGFVTICETSSFGACSAVVFYFRLGIPNSRQLTKCLLSLFIIKTKTNLKDRQNPFTFTQDAAGIYIELFADQLPYVFAANCLQQQDVCSSPLPGLVSFLSSVTEGGLESLCLRESFSLWIKTDLFLFCAWNIISSIALWGISDEVVFITNHCFSMENVLTT